MASRVLLPLARRALGAAAAASLLSRAPALSEASDDDDAPVPPELDPPSYSLYLPKPARDALAQLAPPTHARTLAERICGAPALTADEGAADGEVDVLAIASDGSTQTALLAVPEQYSGRCVYVTLSASEALDPAQADAASEALWRALEASGQLVVDRSRYGVPRRALLRSGAAEWAGAVGRSELATVKLRASRHGTSAALLRVPAVACAPEAWEKGACTRECGFCKFMKGGPCREQFVAWEACVDRCRESGADFIAECGQHTLDLKHCTDEHPEYYGALMSDAEENAAERRAAATEAEKAGSAPEGVAGGSKAEGVAGSA
jgi:hypothetical protein